VGIQFVNQSTVVTADALTAFLAALEKYLAEAVAPEWGIPDVPAGTTIMLLDEPGSNDPSDALGYHDVNGSTPYGRVFCKLAQDSGIAWTIVASHEAIELSVDQRCNQVTFLAANPQGTAGWQVIQEPCDPCEMQSTLVNGVQMSGFVYRAWFMPGFIGKVDNLGLVPGPLKIMSGGYASANYVTRANGWQSFNAFLKQANNPM